MILRKLYETLFRTKKKRRQFTVKITPAQSKRLDEICDKLEMSRHEYVTYKIQEALKKRNGTI